MLEAKCSPNTSVTSPVSPATLTLANYNTASSLIFGIGNVGRQDDGLGWAFIDWLETTSICPQAQTLRGYQLCLEDADLISHKERVLFVDATKSPQVSGFQLEAPLPKMDQSFTSHALSVGAVLATCQQCFDRIPDVQFLTIRGYEWELSEGLTSAAQQNLDAATAFFLSALPLWSN